MDKTLQGYYISRFIEVLISITIVKSKYQLNHCGSLEKAQTPLHSTLLYVNLEYTHLNVLYTDSYMYIIE